MKSNQNEQINRGKSVDKPGQKPAKTENKRSTGIPNTDVLGMEEQDEEMSDKGLQGNTQKAESKTGKTGPKK